MGIILGIETETGEEIPLWFTETDSKLLRRQLWDAYYGSTNVEIFRIFNHFHLSVKPLTKIVGRGEEEELNELFSRDPNNAWGREYGPERMAVIQTAWQSPESLIKIIQPLLAGMEQEPKVFAELNIADEYFVDGAFCHDMMDLVTMLDWALRKGIRKVRLVEG